VESVGVIFLRSLPFTLDNTIRFLRHAVRLDEHRTTFGVTLCQPENEVTDRDQDQDLPCVKEMWFAGTHAGTVSSLPPSLLPNFIQTISLIVGFVDVGGGAKLDTALVSLSNISLRWMLHEIQSIDDVGLDRLRLPASVSIASPLQPRPKISGKLQMARPFASSMPGRKLMSPRTKCCPGRRRTTRASKGPSMISLRSTLGCGCSRFRCGTASGECRGDI